MRVARLLSFAAAVFVTGAALADVDVRTPWTDVYVGPGGVHVAGPWGGVDVPASRRDDACERWRDEVEDYYDAQDCDVDFTDNDCAIEEVECDD